MSGNFYRFANFPKRQKDVSALVSDTVDLPIEGMIIYCGTSGTIKVSDCDGTAVTYTVAAGEVLIPLVHRVYTTGTTVTQIIGYY